MAAIRANVCSLAAVVVVVTPMVWAWGSGENGDLEFAVLCAAVAVAAFALGAWTRRWWMVPAICAAWFCGWMVAGELAPDTYAGAIAFSAPGPAILVALGVGTGRRRSRPV